MDELMLTLTAAERREYRQIMAIALGVLCLLGLLIGRSFGSFAVAAYAIVFVVLIALAWSANEGWTRIGKRGIVVKRALLPGRTISWDEVASVYVKRTEVPFFGSTSTIRIRMVSGRQVRLLGVERSLRRPDVHFDEKFAQICRLRDASTD
ncbi:hypothetical protein [Streptacidiphilus sp. MAP12-20]|uniref:hypothetical protein n=1 Tax=Streptacidiphilus sp. MAP12-20 TaxID=3156299 RepID=UPI0035197C21